MGVLEATVDSNGREDYTELREVPRGDFNHAVVCTPPQTHAKHVRELLEMEKHVFVEKPLTTTTKEAQELLELAQSKRLKLQCGYIERFNPIIQNMDFPKFSVFERHNRRYNHIKDTIMRDTAVHDIAIAIQQYGNPVSVTGSVEDDWCSLLLECDHGTASINCSWQTDQKIRMINGISTMTSDDILKSELDWFLQSDPIINVDWQALLVQEVIEDVERS